MLTNLADKEQGEKKTPDKFLDRLQEALCKFTNVDPESTEEGMVLKVGFSLTQLKISAVSYKNRRLDQISLQKTVQLSQMVYHGKEYKEENRREKKKTWPKTKAPTMAVRSTLKQPVKKCPEEPR